MRAGNVVISTLSILALLLIAGSISAGMSSYSFATSSNSQQSLTMSIQSGGITNAGPQQWTMSGGVLAAAEDTATTILGDATWTSVTYSMTASVNGLTASGHFKLELTGTTKAGQQIMVKMYTRIVGAIPAVCFPSYSVTGTCAPGDTSEIPAYFLATGHVRIETGTSLSPKYSISLVIEDAALNAFGSPIVISSTDSTFLVVATYSSAHTDWQGVQTAGELTGSLGSTSVSGAFTQTIHTEEDYITGTAQDYGQIYLVGMSPSSLDSHGQFHGTSTIPTTGTIDCSPSGLPGTCTETGYNSAGTFTMSDPGGSSLQGSYNVQWPAPSITFGGNITGTFG